MIFLHIPNPSNEPHMTEKHYSHLLAFFAQARFLLKIIKDHKEPLLPPSLGSSCEAFWAINYQLEHPSKHCIFKLPTMVKGDLKSSMHLWAKPLQDSIIAEHKEDLFQGRSSKQALFHRIPSNKWVFWLLCFVKWCYALGRPCFTDSKEL